jgi:hypothetical protein
MRNAACLDFLQEILIFKGLTARRLYKSFGVQGLKLIRNVPTKIILFPAIVSVNEKNSFD